MSGRLAFLQHDLPNKDVRGLVCNNLNDLDMLMVTLAMAPLFNTDVFFRQHCMELAVSDGHTRVMTWMQRCLPAPLTPELVWIAVEYNQPRSLAWLIKVDCPREPGYSLLAHESQKFTLLGHIFSLDPDEQNFFIDSWAGDDLSKDLDMAKSLVGHNRIKRIKLE